MKDKTFKIMALLVVFLCCGVAVINATTDTAVITVTSHVTPVDVSTTSTVSNILGMFYLSDGTDAKLTSGAVDSGKDIAQADISLTYKIWVAKFSNIYTRKYSFKIEVTPFQATIGSDTIKSEGGITIKNSNPISSSAKKSVSSTGTGNAVWEESNINWLDMHGRCGLNPSANPLEVFDIEYGKDPRLPVADNSGTDYKSTITFTITNE